MEEPDPVVCPFEVRLKGLERASWRESALAPTSSILGEWSVRKY